MPLTAKERMQRYRNKIKADPVKHAEYLQKEKERWKKRREENKLPPLIKDMNQREQRSKRKQWRKEIKERREKKRQRDEMIKNASVIISPPTSPTHSVEEVHITPEAKRGRKYVKRDRAKAYKKIKKLEEELIKKSREADKYRKRYERLVKKTSSNKSEQNKKYSIRVILKESKLRGNLRKQLLLHCVVAEQIRRKMKAKKLLNAQEKRILSNVVSKKILKKYNLMSAANELLGITQKRLKFNSLKQNRDKYSRRKYKNALSERVKERVRLFLEEDINSRMMPGKKDTITRKKLKKQKRILTNSMKNLHSQFLLKNNDIKISYTMFCKLRPFWVLDPKCEKRDTCTCKLHANVQFKFSRLKQYGILKCNTLKEACESMCCNAMKKECMYRECSMCKDKCLETNDYEEGKQVWVYTWQNRHEQRVVKDKTQAVQITVKEKVFSTLSILVDEMNKELKNKFCRHVYNITHQYEKLKILKENIADKECIIHIDFSENYACKLNTEVQGMHFGASRNQASLHTGIVYLKDRSPMSFCSISDNTRHDPASIWAHLSPILQKIKTENPDIDTIHFISDGPTTQYRSRNNFYLLKQKCMHKYCFKTATWNFTEAGHGKGAPDGVGGLVKRTADKLVAYGRDISDASELFKSLNEADMALSLFYITNQMIFEVDNELSNIEILPVKGTMLIHQIICVNGMNCIYVRDLSCFCDRYKVCECLSPRQVALVKQSNATCLQDKHLNTSQKRSDNSVGSSVATTDTKSISAASVDQTLSPLASQTKLMSGDIDFSVDIIGKWVVVEYDELPYPGIVQDVDHDSVVVKVMHSIGKNRYFWPARDDILNYYFDKILIEFSGMENVTSRHMQLPSDIWDLVCRQFDI